MEYGKPTKLSDGRYFLRMTDTDGQRIFKQINGAEVQEANCFKVPVNFNDIDEDVINQAEKNSEDWFNKKLDRETIKNAYDSSVSAGIIEAPYAKRNGTVVTKVYDKDKNEISVDVLTPGTQCDIIVELTGLWFIKKSFGPVWRVVQVRMKKESSFPNAYFFKDDASDDEYM
jgi:hypothetical protein